MTIKERKAQLIIDLTKYIQTAEEGLDMSIVDLIIWENRISMKTGYKIFYQLVTNLTNN